MQPERLDGPVFVVGFPRSGTTLMQSLLSAHPGLAISPETHFLNRFAEDVPGYDLGTADRFAEFWNRFTRSDRFIDLGIDADSVRDSILATGDFHLRNVFASTLQAFAVAAGKPRWGEKTPAHDQYIATLLEWFPEARVIYMVRDPRAACASLVQAPWRIRTRDGEGGRERPGTVRRLQVLEEDSRFWRASVERYRREWREDGRVASVRYEDLVERPEETLRTVCAFVDLQFLPGMLEPRSDAALPPPRAQLADREHQEWRSARIEKARQEVSTDSLVRWKTDLTALEVAIIEANCEREMLMLGYALDGGDGSYGRRLRRLGRAAVVLYLGARRPFAGAGS